jgi:exosortase
VWVFLTGVWRRPHYQFFPFLLAAAAYLAWKNWPPAADDEQRERGSVLAGLLLLAGITLLIGDIVLLHGKHWLAGVSAVFVAGGLMLHFAGKASLRSLIPVWLLLWLVIPLPLGQDYRLIQDLQLVTAQLTSMVLDVFNVAHLLDGVVLVFPGKRLFVEQACSGIQSLFALLACTAVYVVWARRPLVPALLLLSSAVFWAVVANMVRVATVAFAFSANGMDLSAGWLHGLLGLVVFALALGLIASTDALLMFLIGPLHTPPWLARVFGRVVARSQLSSRERSYVSDDGGYLSRDRDYVRSDHGYYVNDDDRHDYYVKDDRRRDYYVCDDLPYVAEDEPARRGKRRRERGETREGEGHGGDGSSASETRRASLLNSSSVLRSYWTALLVGIAGILGVLALMLTASEAGDVRFVLEAAERIHRDALPERIAAWKRGEYDTVERGVGSPFGQYSQSWDYEASSFAVAVSLDYPFYDWHDLGVCYRGQGWKIINRRQMRGRLKDDPYVSMEMVEPAGTYGYVAFDEFDSRGRPVVEPYSVLWSRIWRRIKLNPLWAFFLGRETVELQQVTFQFQVFAAKPEPWSKRELSDIQKRFVELRDVVRRSVSEGPSEVANGAN